MKININEYENLISTLASIHHESLAAPSEQILFNRIVEYIDYLTQSDIGNAVIQTIQESDESENDDLNYAYRAALEELSQVSKQVVKSLKKDSTESVSETKHLQGLIEDKIPIRDNKALLIYSLLENICVHAKSAKIDALVKLDNLPKYRRFKDLFDNWTVRKDTKAWEAWRALSWIYIMVDSAPDYLAKPGNSNDPLIYEDLQTLKDEIYQVKNGLSLTKRKILNSEAELREYFSLLHRFINNNLATNLSDDKTELNIGKPKSVEPEILNDLLELVPHINNTVDVVFRDSSIVLFTFYQANSSERLKFFKTIAKGYPKYVDYTRIMADAELKLPPKTTLPKFHKEYIYTRIHGFNKVLKKKSNGLLFYETTNAFKEGKGYLLNINTGKQQS